MGGGSWSSDEYEAREASRAKTGASPFAYTDKVIAATPYSARKVHDKMNPKGINRECRDSDEHPNSRPIAVFFDVTGSMGGIPRVLQTKLSKLMTMLLLKGACPDPQICMGAIGDANCDKAPLQVGQFESDIKIEEDLGNIWIEGGGGGTAQESYEMAAYFAARHMKMDCFEKRGEKGYLFLMGDEMCYGHLRAAKVSEFIGDDISEECELFKPNPRMDLQELGYPLAKILAEASEKFEVFFIFTPSHNYSADCGHVEWWKALLHERVIVMPDPAAVCETIAGVVAMLEGMDHSDIDSHLKAAGADSKTASTVKNALAPLASRSVAKGTVKGDLATSGAGSGTKTL